jgi:hypothetical protein
VAPLELDAAMVGRLREQIAEAIYDSRAKTLSLRVGEGPGDRLGAVLQLAEALSAALAEPVGV